MKVLWIDGFQRALKAREPATCRLYLCRPGGRVRLNERQALSLVALALTGGVGSHCHDTTPWFVNDKPDDLSCLHGALIGVTRLYQDVTCLPAQGGAEEESRTRRFGADIYVFSGSG